MFLLKPIFRNSSPKSLAKKALEEIGVESFLGKPFSNVKSTDYSKDVIKLKIYFDRVFENHKELGVDQIFIGPNVFVYNSSAGSMLSGSKGFGGDLSVSGINGNNDILAKELGADVSFMGMNYYQFRLRKKFQKKQMIVILEQLCRKLQSEYNNVTFEFNKKVPRIYVYLRLV